MSHEILRYRAVIFDLDGTLLNTLDDLHQSVQYALSALSLPATTREQTRLAVGDGIGNLIARSMENGHSNPQFEACLALFKDYYAIHSTDFTAPYDGVPSLLEALRERGIHIGVVSNKIDSAVNALCRRYFDGLVDHAIGEREGVRRKPAPDSLLACIDAFSLSPSDCLYVGDSEQDILTAKNAGTAILSVTWGFRTKDALLKAGGKDFATSPEELLHLLT